MWTAAGESGTGYPHSEGLTGNSWWLRVKKCLLPLQLQSPGRGREVVPLEVKHTSYMFHLVKGPEGMW